MEINKTPVMYNKNIKSPKNNRKNINFGAAIAGPLVAFSTFLENNGFLGEFLTVDAVGMATPRTVQGYMRNREELGHLNYKAGREELVREALSGPAFFFVPLGVVAAAALLKGKAAKVTTKTLGSFHNIMKKTSQKNIDLKDSKKIKSAFLNTLFKDSFKDYKESGSNNYINSIRKTFDDLLEKKISKKEAKKQLNESMTLLNKTNGKFIDDTLSLKLTDKHVINITNLVDDIPNYLDDFTKKAQTSKTPISNFIDKFDKKAQNIRKVTNIVAVSALAAFLSLIPRLYQVDKKFPGLEGLEGGQGSPKQNPAPVKGGLNANT